MDRWDWRSTVHRTAKSQAWVSDWAHTQALIKQWRPACNSGTNIIFSLVRIQSYPAGLIVSCHQVTYWAGLKSYILAQKIKAFNSFLGMSLILFIQFPSGSVVKCLPAMQETWVLSLVREDHLEKEMETDSSILKNPIDRRAWWGCSPWGCKEWLCTHKQFKCLLYLILRILIRF